MDIEIRNLTKKYGYQKAVDDISFSVKKGEILGFLGPNGAGKTTTMKLLTGFFPIEDGEITIGGLNVRNQSSDVKRKIGYLPENNPLYPEMGVIEYLIYVAELQSVPKNQIEERVKEVIKLTGLNREKHKRIGELSKGYRQRVGLAQAIIHDPEVLVLDEPTTGLDPNQIVEIRNLIRDLGKEKTVILSTHILPEVEATCDRILIINKGRIVANGTPDSLRKQASGQNIIRIKVEDLDEKTVENIFGTIGFIEKIVKMPDNLYELTCSTTNNPERIIFETVVKNEGIITHLSTLETSLEDIFRNLTLNQ